LQAIFDPASLKDRRNSAAIEVAPNVLISVRVTDYEPVGMRPFDSVSSEIRSYLTRKAAVDKATSDGELRLADLNAGKNVSGLSWSPSRSVSRLQPGGLTPDAIQLIGAADVNKLPAYVGSPSGADGFAIYKVSSVKAGAALTDEKRAQIAAAYQRFLQQADVVSLMVALRDRHPVKVSKRLEQ
jgi:peptidyl-prolyl cis-trans isomerase D